MKKQDLKQLIKPLVKECIHEVLIEEGLLSNVVSEVAKGMQGNLVVENKKQKHKEPLFKDELPPRRSRQDSEMKLQQQRKKLMDAIGNDAYNGVNVFEGTEPLKKAGDPSNGNSMPSVLGDDPGDSGVDITSLIGGASKVWKAIK